MSVSGWWNQRFYRLFEAPRAEVHQAWRQRVAKKHFQVTFTIIWWFDNFKLLFTTLMIVQNLVSILNPNDVGFGYKLIVFWQNIFSVDRDKNLSLQGSRKSPSLAPWVLPSWVSSASWSSWCSSLWTTSSSASKPYSCIWNVDDRCQAFPL